MQETGTDSEFHLTVTRIRRDGRLDDGGNGPLAQGKRVRTRSPVPAPPSAANQGTQQARLRAQMLNGVTLEFECTGRDADLISTVIETLGRCHVSPGR